MSSMTRSKEIKYINKNELIDIVIEKINEIEMNEINETEILLNI